MNRLLLAAVFLALASCQTKADIVTDWNNVALSAIKVDQTPPPKASWALAILHVAIYDSVNGILGTHEPYFVVPQGLRTSTVDAAVAAAGRAVLVKLFPAQQATFDAAYATGIGRIRDGARRRQGVAWGEFVSTRILNLRENDGASATVAYTPGTAPGDWQPTPPAFAAALLPQWPKVTPFCMKSGTHFRPAPVPKLDSAIYAIDYAITKQ